MKRCVFLFCLLIFFLIAAILLHNSLQNNWELKMAEELDQDTEQLQLLLQNYFAISFTELKALVAFITPNPEILKMILINFHMPFYHLILRFWRFKLLMPIL